MNIDLVRLLLDFGLVVLIWIVQLVIYPSPCYYQDKDLAKWHKIYTQRIGVIVGPLMIAQLAIALWQLWLQSSIYTWVSIIIIVTVWILTFSIFVPLHDAISPSKSCEKTTATLVTKNWWRTFLWSILFLGSIMYYTLV